MVQDFVCHGVELEQFGPRRVCDLDAIKLAYFGGDVGDRICRMKAHVFLVWEGTFSFVTHRNRDKAEGCSDWKKKQ
ncbi:hypothetical protein HanIR_Chr13g0637871 [Helianthus annuus]|nr:hypothetical protein HanIR_Chr13g0637871 [Helianthus annuus]